MLIISWKFLLKWPCSQPFLTWEGATGGSCGTVEICRGFSGALLAGTGEPCAGNGGSRWGAGGSGHTGWLLSTCCREAACEMGCCCGDKKEKVTACALQKNQMAGHAPHFSPAHCQDRPGAWSTESQAH